MLSNSHHFVLPKDDAERAYLESLIRDDFDRTHPGTSLADVKRRASFSKEDRCVYRDWLALAAARAARRRAAQQEAAE